MNKEKIIAQTSQFVKKKLSREPTGHDWWHTQRVLKNALKIAQKEKGVDLFIIKLAALLHDLEDWKFSSSTQPKLVRQWLQKLSLDKKTISHICEIIQDLSFKGAGVKTPMRTKEGQIVQDADRLDALGALGIARAFAYGGYKKREIYNPSLKPQKHLSFHQYKKSSGTTINHFYEKLLLLKNLMNTKTAQKIAQERHLFMEKFLQRFFEEWQGKK